MRRIAVVVSRKRTRVAVVIIFHCCCEAWRVLAPKWLLSLIFLLMYRISRWMSSIFICSTLRCMICTEVYPPQVHTYKLNIGISTYIEMVICKVSIQSSRSNIFICNLQSKSKILCPSVLKKRVTVTVTVTVVTNCVPMFTKSKILCPSVLKKMIAILVCR